MKKVLICALVLIMAISVCSCGKSSSAKPANAEAQSSTVTQTTIYRSGAAIATAVGDSSYSDSAVKLFHDDLKQIDPDNNHVKAIVNGESVYLSEIIASKAISTLQINSNLSKSPQLSEKEKKEYYDKYNQTDDEILQGIIRDKVLIQAAKKSGIKVLSDDELYKKYKDEIELIKKQGCFFEAISKGHMIKEEQAVILFAREKYLRSEYEKEFVEENNITSREEGIAKYQEHLDNLAKQAQIIYK